MAGDWIKMRVGLIDDPAVIKIAALTGLAEDHVVGKLHLVWSWGDAHTVDGHAASVTAEWLDRYVRHNGFAAAMIAANWLVVDGDGVHIPRFDRHNGQSAKKRALAADRKRTSRALVTQGVTATSRETSRIERDGSVTREEKRRSKELTGNLPLQSDFVVFWLRYPKKKNKGDAERAWNAGKPKLDSVLAGLERAKHSAQWLQDAGRFIPHPATWIRARGWEDEATAPEGDDFQSFLRDSSRAMTGTA